MGLVVSNLRNLVGMGHQLSVDRIKRYRQVFRVSFLSLSLGVTPVSSKSPVGPRYRRSGDGPVFRGPVEVTTKVFNPHPTGPETTGTPDTAHRFH